MDRWRTVSNDGIERKRGVSRGFRRGQTAVVIALAVPALLGALALGVDVGLMYLNWADLQKAADSAVLAGANSLPGNPAGAITTADLWATNDGVKASEIVATSVAPDDMSVTISLQRTVPYNFAQVLGLVNQQISVTATGGVQQNPDGVSGLLPIGLPCDSGSGYGPGGGYGPDCAYDQQQGPYQIKNGQVGPGNWAPLELGGTPGADAYRKYMELGFTGTIAQTVPTETGNLVGPTGQAVSNRLSKGQTMYPQATYSAHQDYDPRLVAVPLIYYNDPNGKKPVTIVGYAQVWLDSVSGPSSGNAISLYFVGWLSQPAASNSPTTFGLNTPILLH